MRRTFVALVCTLIWACRSANPGESMGDAALAPATSSTAPPSSTVVPEDARSAPLPSVASTGTGSSPSMSIPHVHHYVCPMHPKVVRNAPGDCPECGMHLVPRDGGQK